MSLILAATGVLMVIAVVLDLIMSWFEGQMRKSRGGSKKMWIPVAAIVLAFILLLPYGRGGTGDILLYDGDYSENPADAPHGKDAGGGPDGPDRHHSGSDVPGEQLELPEG